MSEEAASPMIELQGITLDYPSGDGGAPLRVLHGVDLSVREGEVFGIIGRSGAGKSSLVRCINLLNRPTHGRVVVAGTDLTALPPDGLRAARRRIGMVFQHFNLLSSRTVFGNVALPLELAGMPKDDIRERVLPLLELVGLAELADRYPAQISGGQKQRVGIARALASRPQVLLSDEATSALDPETTRSILALLQRINEEMGLTIVLITHQIQVIRQTAQRVAVMEAGRIVEQGDVLEVFTRPQQATTRSLIDEVMPQTLPLGVCRRMAALREQLPAGHEGRLLRLLYSGEQAAQPLLSRLVRELDVDVNILHGQMDDIQGSTFGALAVLLSGRAADVQSAVLALLSQGVQVRDVTKSVMRDAAAAEAEEEERRV